MGLDFPLMEHGKDLLPKQLEGFRLIVVIVEGEHPDGLALCHARNHCLQNASVLCTAQIVVHQNGAQRRQIGKLRCHIGSCHLIEDDICTDSVGGSKHGVLFRSVLVAKYLCCADAPEIIALLLCAGAGNHPITGKGRHLHHGGAQRTGSALHIERLSVTGTQHLGH